MKLIHDIEDLEPTIKDKLIFLANAIIRDSKTKKLTHHTKVPHGALLFL